MAGQRKDVARRTNSSANASGSDISAGAAGAVGAAGVSLSSAGTGAGAGDAGGLPAQRMKKWAPKVRTGCLTCRTRRVKCDEGKPECSRCVSTGRTCKGYQDVGSKATRRKTESQSQSQSQRRPSSLGARPSRPLVDQDPPSSGVDFDTGTSESPFSFDRSLSASSSINQAPDRESSTETHSTDQHLSDLLGGLKVDEVGIAPYLRRKARPDEQLVAEEDDDDDDDDDADDDESEYLNLVLPLTKTAKNKLRIPPQLMPANHVALRYFDLYFELVHPYVPVLDKVSFHRQWNAKPESLSPLILETIFAIGSRLGGESKRTSNRWLELASKHADEFMDVPRLSTLQALLIIIKAREGAPQRGYYYRSWMMIAQCVRMGKDLGLDEHHEHHRSGRANLCILSPAECRLHTRLWQVIFTCETMIGTPQGRHDLSVNLETVDFDEPSPPSKSAGAADDYETEHIVSINFTYLARLVRNIRQLNSLYLKLKKKKSWGIQPEYLAFEQTMSAFVSNLPPHLAVKFPSDDQLLPWLSSPFVGHLHSYYYLSIILFHRGVLGFLDASVNKSLWKRHMMICYDSARYLCRLQEATKKQFGLLGLQSMQRGFSFTVYTGLSCIVLHLVAIVSPDPDLNSDAREYFERHMRIMEEVMHAWAMPDLQKQIDAFREAFSADLTKPFVLRPEFPNVHQGRAPSSQFEQPLDDIKLEPVDTVQFQYDIPSDQPSNLSSLLDLPLGNHSAGGSVQLEPRDIPLPPPTTQSSWNPAPIFQTWNSFFAPPPPKAPLANQAPLPHQQQAPLQSTMNNYPANNSSAPPMEYSSSNTQNAGPSSILPKYDKTAQIGPPQQVAQQYHVTAMPGFITPGMWQQLVATVYEEGQMQHF